MKIAIVGEAWGKDEEIEQRPFVGEAGRVLDSMLSQVGIDRASCLVTNVFNLRPKPTNDVKNLCGPKGAGIPGYPALQPGKYVDQSYGNELVRLFNELTAYQPNVTIAFGATPAWALLKTSGIRAIRGAPARSHLGLKVLPTYHPAAVRRDWSLRPIVIADLFKAKREAEFPEVRRPKREIWIEPTLKDLADWDERIALADVVSIDIETIGNMITCIGFAPAIDAALVVPFYDPSKPDGNYWPSQHDERIAWDWVRTWCESSSAVFQNGLYDIHFLWRTMGITVPHATHDTMLLHHALQPEMEKSLGFLGTIYTDEASWKFMRKKNQTVKRED